jgi:hypothetical protein
MVFLVNSITKTINENQGSFTELLIEHFQKMKNNFQTELVDVGEKFQQQIDNYLRMESDVEKNNQLQERIKKGADYFYEKVSHIVVEGIEKADLDIDNRTLKRQIKGWVTDLEEEAKTKLAGYSECHDGFSVKRIMDARAKAMIENSISKPKKQKAKEIVNSENIPHPELYKLLRSFRYEKASELGIPPYMIFSQKSLIELVNYLPVDSGTLQLINGLGARKISQFGAEIIDLIQGYCDENNIDKGEIPLKETSPKKKEQKPDTKKVSLEMFQAGKTIEEIANERGLVVTTIASHLANYIKLGELDVLQLLPKEKLDKIVEYFKNADNRNLTPAVKALGEEFSYSDLRMGLSYLESDEK